MKFLKKKTSWALLLVCGGAVAVFSCVSARQPANVAIVRDRGSRVVPATEVAQGKIYPELLDLAEYAALSANVYEDEVRLDQAHQVTESFVAYCKTENVFWKPSGWQLETDLPPLPPPPQWGHKVKGLKYQVWVRQPLGTPAHALLVFRGTVPTNLGDWWSNLRWFTRFVPFIWDEYSQARAIVPDIVGHLRQKYGRDVRIVATGHSLGGGLAQEAGYVSGNVREVYAFDPSAVTGYFSVAKKQREENQKGEKIYRVYEKGEILEYLRWIMKRVWPIAHSNPTIVEIRFNLLPGGSTVKQHSMKKFACELHRLGSVGQ